MSESHRAATKGERIKARAPVQAAHHPPCSVMATIDEAVCIPKWQNSACKGNPQADNAVARAQESQDASCRMRRAHV